MAAHPPLQTGGSERTDPPPLPPPCSEAEEDFYTQSHIVIHLLTPTPFPSSQRNGFPVPAFIRYVQGHKRQAPLESGRHTPQGKENWDSGLTAQSTLCNKVLSSAHCFISRDNRHTLDSTSEWKNARRATI